MPVEYFIRYRGRCYGVGTRLKFEAKVNGYYCGIKEGVIEQFAGTMVFIRGDDGILYKYSTTKYLVDFDKVIIEIINPSYYIMEGINYSNRECPQPWDFEIGLIWYIIIMVVGTLFNARLIIWIVSTVIFFLWKNGFLNGGNN